MSNLTEIKVVKNLVMLVFVVGYAYTIINTFYDEDFYCSYAQQLLTISIIWSAIVFLIHSACVVNNIFSFAALLCFTITIFNTSYMFCTMEIASHFFTKSKESDKLFPFSFIGFHDTKLFILICVAIIILFNIFILLVFTYAQSGNTPFRSAVKNSFKTLLFVYIGIVVIFRMIILDQSHYSDFLSLLKYSNTNDILKTVKFDWTLVYLNTDETTICYKHFHDNHNAKEKCKLISYYSENSNSKRMDSTRLFLDIIRTSESQNIVVSTKCSIESNKSAIHRFCMKVIPIISFNYDEGTIEKAFNTYQLTVFTKNEQDLRFNKNGIYEKVDWNGVMTKGRMEKANHVEIGNIRIGTGLNAIYYPITNATSIDSKRTIIGMDHSIVAFDSDNKKYQFIAYGKYPIIIRNTNKSILKFSDCPLSTIMSNDE